MEILDHSKKSKIIHWIAYLDDVLMVKVRGLSLECLAACHLETEESAHRLLRGIGILLSFNFLIGVGNNLGRVHNWLREGTSLTLLRGGTDGIN